LNNQAFLFFKKCLTNNQKCAIIKAQKGNGSHQKSKNEKERKQ
jgi:hypothetical protein